MELLSVIEVQPLVRLYSEQTSFVLFYSDVLALKCLFLLLKVTTDVDWQLLNHSIEQLCVAERIFLISELSNTLL